MKELAILWQRLVDESGRTCVRCGATETQVRQAVDTLKLALAPLGIAPRLEIGTLDDVTFRTNPSESNRIWIGGRPMEDWLDAGVGSSRCCSVCGEARCRTVEVEGQTYETIPEKLIVKAGLLAAAQIVTAG